MSTNEEWILQGVYRVINGLNYREPVDDERLPEIPTLTFPADSSVAALCPVAEVAVQAEMPFATDETKLCMALVVSQPNVGSSPRSVARATTLAVSPQPAEREAYIDLGECMDVNMVEPMLRKLKGTRPDLFRTSTYYDGA